MSLVTLSYSALVWLLGNWTFKCQSRLRVYSSRVNCQISRSGGLKLRHNALVLGSEVTVVIFAAVWQVLTLLMRRDGRIIPELKAAWTYHDDISLCGTSQGAKAIQYVPWVHVKATSVPVGDEPHSSG